VFQPDGYADLTGLQSLASASVKVRSRTWRVRDDDVTPVTITNAGGRKAAPAFMARADVPRGLPDGSALPGDNQVLPILRGDNDVTLSRARARRWLPAPAGRTCRARARW
jgi:exo-1,4-beta-D-glucosaminidase